MNSLWWMLVICFLTGCRANTEPLDVFYAQAEELAKVNDSRLFNPEKFTVTPYIYSANNSPFSLPKPKTIENKDEPLNKRLCNKIMARKKLEMLEKYSLAKLKFKGVIESGNEIIAIMQLPNNELVRVHKGQYIGNNNGLVIDITLQYIRLKEKVIDDIGCEKKRYIKLLLKH